MSEMIKAEDAARFDRSHFGFWVYLMTDCVLFATLFAAYAVLRNSTAGGPHSFEIFKLNFVLIETLILLSSSLTCGLFILAAQRKNIAQFKFWILMTFLLGATFLGMEIYEFRHLVAEGASWHRSAFLSSYFTLVGTHGLHITVGLLWILVLMFRVLQGGVNPSNLRKLSMFGMFWHFLDIIWILIFTVVYLFGVAG